MEKQRRREITNAFKERKVRAGVFSVRCAATGETWVGTSRNLDSQQNSIWFGLRMGSHRNKAMQAAWKAHGEEAFEFAPVEVIELEDVSAYILNQRLAERLAHWREALKAGLTTA
ncbi:MAG TPA: GIY-YIG nuclease family protein [Phenylobacterium sp.]|nr:GIY-YIG nuclease family protein [Phenylobacterium sp.]